jgi:hypothetical protein
VAKNHPPGKSAEPKFAVLFLLSIIQNIFIPEILKGMVSELAYWKWKME